VPDLIVHLPRRRWLRAPVETAIPLGRCLLASARHDDRGRELVIRRPDGSGWRIDMPRDGQPSAATLDRRGRASGTALVSETELAPLIGAIDRELATSRLPRHARDVLLDGTRLTEVDDTTLAARALLGELAPAVHAIRQRSRMPGELTLKRDIADGRREEIYISRASLTARYASLPTEYRRLLDDAGFGRGLTTGIAELTERASQPEIPARPSPAPARAAAPVRLARASVPTFQPQLQPRTSAPAIPAHGSDSAIPTPIPAQDALPRHRHETLPLLATPLAAPLARTSVPARPATQQPQDDERARRRREERTIPSVVVTLPFRRLATPTG
jgi:hypothetical protein